MTKNKQMKSMLSSMLVISMCLVLSIGMISADVCTGQDCSASTTITLGNSAPTVNYVSLTSPITLNGGTTKNVLVTVNVTDSNGYTDINDSSVLATIHKGGDSYSNPSACSVLGSSSTEVSYGCMVPIQFYADAGSDWVVNVTASDIPGSTARNDSVTATINALDYITQDITSIIWSSVTTGQNDAEANAPMVLTNGGNQDYTNISIKARNATGTTYSNVIEANQFSISDLTSQTSGQTYMADSEYVQVSALTGLNNHGASVTENIYFYLDVPIVQADTYTSDGDWSIKVSS